MEYILAWEYARNMSKLEVSSVSRKDFIAFLCLPIIKFQVFFLFPFVYWGKLYSLLWETLTGREHLLFYGRLKNLKGAALTQVSQLGLYF